LRYLRPRLRGSEGGVGLKSYVALQNRAQFSDELLAKVLRGVSCREYRETVFDMAEVFGVSASSVSRHLVEAMASEMKKLME